jgi:hypothetical protein
MGDSDETQDSGESTTFTGPTGSTHTYQGGELTQSTSADGRDITDFMKEED